MVSRYPRLVLLDSINYVVSQCCLKTVLYTSSLSTTSCKENHKKTNEFLLAAAQYILSSFLTSRALSIQLDNSLPRLFVFTTNFLFQRFLAIH